MARRRRGLAGLIPRWAATPAAPRVIYLENVEEFADWGPLLPDGKIDPARRGMLFRRWHRQLENLGYRIDMRELRAADYGAPTTRKRLFIVMRRDGGEIIFPEATHGHWRGCSPYRSAAECIDWSIPCPSIFERNKPLAEATLRRIARGIMRYVVNDPNPFIVNLRGTSESHLNNASGIDQPLHTISAGGTHHAVVEPFIVGIDNKSSGASASWAGSDPLRTITTENRFALVAPYVVNTRNGEREGQAPRVRDIRDPFPTVTAQGSQGAVAMAFLAKHYGDTGQRPGIPLREPLSTITCSDHHALVTAFLVAYYGNDKDGQRMHEPMRTITTKDRLGLVMVRGEPHRIIDIGMRMLSPRELYLAQGFPADYTIDHGQDENGDRVNMTKTAQVRMCGNSVSPEVARALVLANSVNYPIAAAA